MLSVSLLEWSDSAASEPTRFPTFWKGEFGLGTSAILPGEFGELRLRLKLTELLTSPV